MITEDYVSFEVAKLLKEKGFNELCRYYYEPDMSFTEVDRRYVSSHRNSTIDYGFERFKDRCVAPTLQMAMKWLREEHNKIIVPSIRVIDPITGIIDCYCVGIYYIPKNNGGALCFISPTPENGYSSYEEACEAGIKYCLENLMNK